MKIALLVCGTRPDIIKLLPLYLCLKNSKKFFVYLLFTGQHDSLAYSIFDDFKIYPDIVPPKTFNNSIKDPMGVIPIFMTVDQYLESNKPNIVVVQGDTTTAFAAALAAFNRKIPVAHLEAGLRTFKKNAPYPEEIYRAMVSHMATYHFCPTEGNVKNLSMTVPYKSYLFKVGNTVIDMLRTFLYANRNKSHISLKRLSDNKILKFRTSSKFAIITSHRRERFGESMKVATEAIVEAAKENKKTTFIYLVHPNKNSQAYLDDFKSVPNVLLVHPLGYKDFMTLLRNAKMVITDSGGIQEEVTYLGIPTVLLREETERPESLSINLGPVLMVGSKNKSNIVFTINYMLNPKTKRLPQNPVFGTGVASGEVVQILESDEVYNEI